MAESFTPLSGAAPRRTNSALLSSEQLVWIKTTLQSRYGEIGWKVRDVSQPIATEIFAIIDLDDKGARTYQESDGIHIIMEHSNLSPDLEKPEWQFIDKDTDLLLLMCHNGKM